MIPTPNTLNPRLDNARTAAFSCAWTALLSPPTSTSPQVNTDPSWVLCDSRGLIWAWLQKVKSGYIVRSYIEALGLGFEIQGLEVLGERGFGVV